MLVRRDNGRLRPQFGAAPGVGDDLRGIVVIDPGERVEEVGVVAARRSVVADPRALGHRVNGLDVERLLAVPAVGSALPPSVVHAREGARHELAELSRRVCAVAVAARVRGGIGGDIRRAVGVGDRDGDAGAVQ